MSGAVVTPELALVDPELAEKLRQLPERKAAMSSTEPSDGMYFVDQQPEPAPLAPPVAPAPPPVEELAQPPVEEPAPPPAAAASLPAEAGATPMVDVPLGTLIFRAGLLAEEQLEDALQEGMRSGKRLGEVLLERGWLHERDLGRLLAGQKGLPFVEITGSDAEPEALAAIPEEKARLQNTLPLRRADDGSFVVAVADPSNELVIENLRRSLGSEPTLVVAPQSVLIRAIDEAYLKFQGQAVPMPALEPQLSEPVPEPVPSLSPEQSLTPEPAQMPTPDPEPAEMPSLQPDPMPEPGMTAPATEPEPAPQPNPVPMLQTEPVESLSAPAVTPLPTSLPPAVEREADQPEPLQPLMTEPVAQVEEALPAPAPEPPAFEESPLVPLQPLVAEPEPSFEPEPPVAAEQPLPPLQPPASDEPVPAPPVNEEPVMPALAAPEPQSASEPILPLAEEPPPPPAPMPEVSPEPDKPAVVHVVVLRLRDGEVLEVGTFPSAAEASSRAQQVVAEVTAAEGQATWPYFSERYLRPDTIVSVDLLEEQADKWSGSAIRSRWAAGE